jgi:site-specific recombinase XerD
MRYFEYLLSQHYERAIPASFSELTLSFLNQLRQYGYTEGSLKRYASSLIHFGLWLHRGGFSAADIDQGMINRFRSHRCRCPGSRRNRRISAKYASRVGRFAEFLGKQGLILEVTPETRATARSPLDAYVRWLRQHAGLAEPTIRRHTDVITRLLPALGGDATLYDTALVRNVLIADTNGRSRGDNKKIATALRSYLRFLAAQGMCRPGLDEAIPVIPQWRLSSLPRYLPGEQIERIIAACDVATPAGLRDRAVLLLLARLGLRAGDIVNLCLNDIDWGEGTIRVLGKGRREARLPLPQDAGDAVVAYLETGRPAVAHPQIFLRSMAPYQPLSVSSVVSCIVRRAISRAGIVNAPSRGANLMRHSAATGMLRGGATLEVIGAVLRHRSLDTTAHYAKVDVGMLSRLAQPWPENTPC